MIRVNHFSTNRRGTKRSALKPPMGVFAVERRRYPRYSIEFPLTYSVVEGKPASHHWGLATDAGKGGILVYLKERIKIGAILKIEMFYVEKLPLKKITATAKVVWSDLATKDSFGEHRYGLQLESIQKGDLNKLRILLRKCRNIVEIKGKISGPPDFGL
jgi:c-di-GMP-binding flagellar brake protein YcgR